MFTTKTSKGLCHEHLMLKYMYDISYYLHKTIARDLRTLIKIVKTII